MAEQDKVTDVNSLNFQGLTEIIAYVTSNELFIIVFITIFVMVLIYIKFKDVLVIYK